jgi:hypothetical protein
MLILPTALSRVHPVFHVRLIKKYYNAIDNSRFPGRVTPSRPTGQIDAYGNELFVIERILDKELRGKTQKIWYLVQWQGYSRREADWCIFTPSKPEPEWADDMDKIEQYERKQSQLHPRGAVTKSRSGKKSRIQNEVRSAPYGESGIGA